MYPIICIIILQVFDVSRKITYKHLSDWLKELREYRAEIPCLCAANKIDSKATFYLLKKKILSHIKI